MTPQPEHSPAADEYGRFSIVPAARRDLEEIADRADRSDDWVRYAANRGRRSNTWLWAARLGDQLAGLVDLHIAWIGSGPAGGDGLLGRTGKAVFTRNLHQPDSILQPYQFGRIHDLVIVNESSYHETGKALVDHCIRQMQQREVEVLQVELHAKDDTAQKLYRDAGFHIDSYLLSRGVPKEPVPADPGIRLAEMKDLSQLSDMVHQEKVTQLQTAPRSISLKANIDWEEYVADKLRSSNIKILVCMENDDVAGYLELRLAVPGQGSIVETVRTLTDRRRREENWKRAFAFSEDMFVRETSRRRGVANRLFWQAARLSQQLGIGEGRASVWADNQPLLFLHHKVGGKLIRIQLSKPV